MFYFKDFKMFVDENVHGVVYWSYVYSGYAFRWILSICPKGRVVGDSSVKWNNFSCNCLFCIVNRFAVRGYINLDNDSVVGNTSLKRWLLGWTSYRFVRQWVEMKVSSSKHWLLRGERGLRAMCSTKQFKVVVLVIRPTFATFSNNYEYPHAPEHTTNKQII